MSLAAGSRLGPYEIVAPLGAGGMGEVYRARDARLNRDVALKVLPESFAIDLDRLARFQREAQVLASLSHPNIGHIYGIENTQTPGAAPGGVTHALVLELIEGPTLADRMAQGPLPLVEAVAIAVQIADALEAAHEQSIVHRDLKPANIKVRDDGTVKVLDFGLAKAMVPAGSSSAVISGSPTMTSPAYLRQGFGEAGTQMGMILGTAAYMAPEQAKGKAIDKRADIWAFGVVLFEMLTGQTLFAGDTVSETLAAVIKDEPKLDRLPPETPPVVRRLLARCLEREPRLRLRDIGEARIALSQPLQEDGIGAPKSPVPRPFIWMAAAGALLLASLTGAIVWRARPIAEMPVRRFELPAAMSTVRFAIAPDGSRVAYVAADAHLYVRAFDAASLAAQDLGEVHVTTNTLAWSPDGRTIAFTSEGRLRSIPAGGGPLFEIASVPATGRALDVAWQPDNTILLSVWREGLYRVPASGGTPEVFVAVNPETEVDFHSIAMLPDRRVVVTTHLRKSEASYRVEIIDQARDRIVLMADAPVNGIQYAQGYLLLSRFGDNEGIWAVPFAERPIDLASAVVVHSGPATFDAADDGTLLVRSGAADSESELVWVDRKGAISPIAGRAFVPGDSSPSLSPDGRRAVLHVTLGSGTALVVRDLENGVDTVLPAREEDRGVRRQGIPKNPGWFPTGDRIVQGTGAIAAARIVAVRPDGSGAPLDLLAGTFARVSPDGRHLLYIEDDRTRRRLRYALFLPDGGVGPPQSLFAGADEPNVGSFDLSPDGSTLAYAAVQGSAGQSNIFLTGFPSGKGRWQVTTDGGVRPRFSREGRELFYVSGSRGSGGPRGRLNAIAVTLSPDVKLGVAATVFEDDPNQPSAFNKTSFDVARDGRFLTTRRVAGAPADAGRVVLIQNWIAALNN